MTVVGGRGRSNAGWIEHLNLPHRVIIAIRPLSRKGESAGFASPKNYSVLALRAVKKSLLKG
jgi:hypothetical protein